MNNQSFDDLVKQKADGHEAPVPAGMWNAIAKKKEKKRRFVFLWWLIPVLLLLIIGRRAIQSDSQVQVAEPIAASNSTRVLQDDKGEAISSLPGRTGADKKSILPPDRINDHSTVTESENSNDPLFVMKNKVGDMQIPVLGGDSKNLADKQDMMAGHTNDRSILKRKKPAGNLSLSNPANLTQGHKSSLPAGEKPAPSKNAEDEEITVAKQQGSILEIKKDTVASLASREPVASKPGIIEPSNTGISPVSGIAGSRDSLQDKQASTKLPDIQVPVDAAKETRKIAIRKFSSAADVSVTPFLPFQQNQSLGYITRSNAGPMQKTEFKADKISIDLQPSFSIGMAVRKKISTRLQLGIGFQYTIIKEKFRLSGNETNTYYSVVDRLENGPGGAFLVKDTVVIITEGTRMIEGINSYKFYSIPLFAQYKLFEKRSWALHLNAGVYVNLSSRYNNAISGKLVQVYPSSARESSPASAVGLDLFTGIRLSKTYGRYGLYAEPVLRYNTRRYDQANMISKRLIHQAGISFGLSYRFGR